MISKWTDALLELMHYGHDESAALLAGSPRFRLSGRGYSNPIRRAAIGGSLKSLEALLLRPESDVLLNDGELQGAIELHRIDALKRLLSDLRVNINDNGHDGFTFVGPVFCAIAENDAEVIQILTARPDLDLDFSKPALAEALHQAIQRGDQVVGQIGTGYAEPDVAKFLPVFEVFRSIPRFDINYRCGQILKELAGDIYYASTALIDAVTMDPRFKLVPNCQYLSPDGALVRRYLLHEIARSGTPEGVLKVAAYAPSLATERNVEGDTVLISAAKDSINVKTFEAVVRIVSHGMLNAVNKKGESALIALIKYRSDDYQIPDRSAPLFENPSLDLCVRDSDGYTAEEIETASVWNRGLVAKELKRRGIACQK